MPLPKNLSLQVHKWRQIQLQQSDSVQKVEKHAAFSAVAGSTDISVPHQTINNAALLIVSIAYGAVLFNVNLYQKNKK